MDRYISLRYKGLGASQVDPSDITQSSSADLYLVKSKRNEGYVYEVDTDKWTCTCSVGRTGYPSGEPCKHQHAVAKHYHMQAPTLVPYFNSEGRYKHAVIALGSDEAGGKHYYESIIDKDINKEDLMVTSTNEVSEESVECRDSGQENLDTMLELIQEHDAMKDEIKQLSSQFVSDVEQRIQQLDMQYLTGIKKFFQVYIGTIHSLEPNTCTTPHLASLLHTYFNKHIPNIAGTRTISVQPTALSRRQRMARGSKLALCGRPTKTPMDSNTQKRRGRQPHTKRKQNLRLNETRNQPNHFKHGQGH